jgi:hypothetical protein
VNRAMIELCYDLCEEKVRLRFFADLAAFEKHTRDHFVGAREPEPWHAVFHPELYKRLSRFPRDGLELEALYHEVIKYLQDGIDFARERPVYIRLVQDRGQGRQQVFYFLACPGYVIVARYGQVRTAYFPGVGPTDTSAYNRFREAWAFLKQKATKDCYWDNKDGVFVQQSEQRWVSEKNWQTCPNPHPRKLAVPKEVSHVG